MWELQEQGQITNGTQKLMIASTSYSKKDVSPTKEEVQAAADAAGESLNGYIVGAVKQRMEKESAGNIEENP